MTYRERPPAYGDGPSKSTNPQQRPIPTHATTLIGQTVTV